MLATLLLAVLPTIQEAPPAPDGPRALYEEVVERYSGAAALHLDFTADMQVTMEGEEATRAEGTIAMRLMKPWRGRIDYEFREASSESAQEMSLLVEGEELLYLVHEARNVIRMPLDLSMMDQMLGLDPMLAWAERKPGEPDSVDWVDGPAPLRGLRGIQVVHGDQRQTWWLDRRGTVIAGSFENDLGGAAFQVDVVFSSTVIKGEADPADYPVEVPEGYEEPENTFDETSFEETLLAVGADAPDVSFTGMDDQGFTLASMKGKTVLLNFWFYH